MDFFVITYGCQMNERDSQVISGQMQQMGHHPVSSPEEADLILLNGCCVRETAEQRLFGKAGELKKYKYQNPQLLIGICGCLAQKEGSLEEIRRRVPHVDLVFGTHNLHRLPDLLAEAQKADDMVVELWPEPEGVPEELPIRRNSDVQALVNIMFGCDNYCAYCIVPYVRGPERSRRPEDVLREVSELAEAGYREVTLLGQNVNSYGQDLPEEISFADLLRRLDGIAGIDRIRYMTSHPKDFDYELIETIARSKKVCEHFHLPLQAGSNSVLRRMNRRYTREEYLDLVSKIRETIPGASVTTDIMVGFPTETEEDFQQTLEVVKRAQFDNAFTFIYCPREGTAASRWEDIEEETKQHRLQRLMETQREITLRRNRRLVNESRSVLIEGTSEKDETVLTSRTRTNRVVMLPKAIEKVGGLEAARRRLIGELAEVEITAAKTWYLLGKIKDFPREDDLRLPRSSQAGSWS